jgi:hypothetical protein
VPSKAKSRGTSPPQVRLPPEEAVCQAVLANRSDGPSLD